MAASPAGWQAAKMADGGQHRHFQELPQRLSGKVGRIQINLDIMVSRADSFSATGSSMIARGYGIVDSPLT